MMEYNLLGDNYTTFKSVGEVPKVYKNYSLLGDLDFTDFAQGVTSSGAPIVKDTTNPENNNYEIIDKMSESHSEEIPTYDETPSKNLPTKGKLADNAKFAYSYLVKKGIPKSSAAGIVGNLWNENLGNPLSTVKDAKNTTAYGIAGFNSKGDLPNLLKWSKENGIQGNPNFQQQLDYLVHCINTRPRLQILLNGKLSTKEASFIWGSEFERFRGQTNNGRGYANINDPEHKKRAATAKTIFETYQS